MKPMGIGINALSRELHVPPNRIHAIVHGARGITADTALRLGTYFDVFPGIWLSLQVEYDLCVAQRDLGKEVARTVRKREAA